MQTKTQCVSTAYRQTENNVIGNFCSWLFLKKINQKCDYNMRALNSLEKTLCKM